MKRRILFACGVCMGATVLGLAVIGSPVSDAMLENVQHLENDPLYPQMRQAIDDGNLDDAQTLMARMLAKDRFQLGMTALGSGALSLAAADFERVLVLDPDHHLARAELARTYFAMDQFVRSRHEFERVLAADPPENVRADIERYLARMDDEPLEERKWSARVVVGALYDDNVNYGPASDFIRIRPLALGGTPINQLVVSGDSLPQETFGAYTYLSVFGQHDAGDPGAWAIFGQGSYYQTWLDNAQDFEIQYLSAAAGPRHATRTHLLDIPLKYEHIIRGERTLVDIVGTFPSFVYAATDEHHWITSGVAEYRDYDELDGLDSAFVKVGQSYRKFFNLQDHNLTVGLFGIRQEADDDAYSYNGVEAVLSSTHRLPWHSSAALRGLYRGEWYDGEEVLAPESREDWQLLLEAQIEKHFTPEWALAFTYQFTHNESTFDLHDFERNFVTLGVVGDL